MDEEFYIKLKERILPYFEGTNPAHDFMHTERVMTMALKIAKLEDADLEIVKISALLHDIARKQQDESCGKICHAQRGAELAKEILKEFNYPEDKMEKICHCIESHRARNNNIPKTKEAMVLFDADKIDGLGAIGVLRTASFAGHIGAVVHNHEVNIENTKPYTKDDSAYREFLVTHKDILNKIMTKNGQIIAKQRNEFMREFFNRANKEVLGEI